MSDKRCCGNCGTGCDSLLQQPCKKWTRNPRKWLDILPTEPGVYFYRKCQHDKWKVGAIEISDRGLVWRANKVTVKYNGQWQGPINPEG